MSVLTAVCTKKKKKKKKEEEKEKKQRSGVFRDGWVDVLVDSVVRKFILGGFK